MLGEEALFRGDNERCGVGECDEAEFCAFDLRLGGGCESPGGNAPRTAVTRAAVAVVFKIARRLTTPENIFFIRMFPLLGHP